VLIYTWIAGGRLKEAQKIVDRWMEKEEGYTEENAEIFGAASLLRTVSGNISVERN
jgi:NifU-like protein involved in Fe-S cluster formation